MEKEDLDEVFGLLISYQDLKLLDTAVRYTKNIPVKQISLPESLSDYRFMRELLNRYTKYIEIKDNEKNLWNLSLNLRSGRHGRTAFEKDKGLSVSSQAGGGQ